MVEKKEIVLICSFIVANTAITALLGDWFIFLGDSQNVVVSHNVSCDVYGKESYNLFGSICGVNLNEIEPLVVTLQTLMSINLAFSLLLYFLIVFKRMNKNMIRVCILIILGLSVSSIVLWSVNDMENLPNDSDKINRYGAGWIAAIICATSSLPMLI